MMSWAYQEQATMAHKAAGKKSKLKIEARGI